MIQVHLLIAKEKRGPYSLEEVRAMNLAGTISGDTVCWKDGSEEKLTVGRLLSAPGEASAEEKPSADQPRRRRRRRHKPTLPETLFDSRKNPFKAPATSTVKVLIIIGAAALAILLVMAIMVYMNEPEKPAPHDEEQTQ